MTCCTEDGDEKYITEPDADWKIILKTDLAEDVFGGADHILLLRMGPGRPFF